MERQRKLSPERKAFISSLIENYHPEDAQNVQEMSYLGSGVAIRPKSVG